MWKDWIFELNVLSTVQPHNRYNQPGIRCTLRDEPTWGADRCSRLTDALAQQTRWLTRAASLRMQRIRHGASLAPCLGPCPRPPASRGTDPARQWWTTRRSARTPTGAATRYAATIVAPHGRPYVNCCRMNSALTVLLLYARRRNPLLWMTHQDVGFTDVAIITSLFFFAPALVTYFVISCDQVSYELNVLCR